MRGQNICLEDSCPLDNRRGGRTLVGNLPYFDLLYVGKYNNYLLPSDGVSASVLVQNIYESSFPFHPFLEGRRYL